MSEVLLVEAGRASVQVGPTGRGPAHRPTVSALDVAVVDRDRHAASRKQPSQLLGDHHRAVTAAGAAERDRQVGLALGLVGGQRARSSSAFEPLEELAVCGLAEHVGSQTGVVRPVSGRSSSTQCGLGRNRSRARCRRRGAGRACSRRRRATTCSPCLGRRLGEQVPDAVAELVWASARTCRSGGRRRREGSPSSAVPCGCPRPPGRPARAGAGDGWPRIGSPGRRPRVQVQDPVADALWSSSSSAFESSPKNTPPRASTTMATRAGPPGSQPRVRPSSAAARAAGCRRRSQPRSSRECAASERPAPDSP